MLLLVIILVMFLFIFECMCQWVLDHSHTTLFCLLGLFIFGYKFLLIICLFMLNVAKLYNYFWFFVSFWGFRRWIGGHARDMGFVYVFAGLAYSYLCRGKGWVRNFDWILLALWCLVRLCKDLALVGPFKTWTWSWLPYHISLFVWMLALALIQFCSHISLFWNLVCYGRILVI